MTIAAPPAVRNAVRQPATPPIVVRMGTPTIGAPASAPTIQPIARRDAGPVKRVPAIASESPGTVASLTAPATLARNSMGKIGASPKVSRQAVVAAIIHHFRERSNGTNEAGKGSRLEEPDRVGELSDE